jgi:uncharacterized protein YceK
MIRPVAVLALLVSCAVVSGCCTLASVCDDREDSNGQLPYGGTARCVSAMQHTLFDEIFIAIPNSRAVCFAFQVCDLPLSAAADTLLLPLTVPYTLAHASARPDASDQPGWDRLFGLKAPPSGTPDRVYGGVGPEY